MAKKHSRVSVIASALTFILGASSGARAEVINFVANLDGACAGSESSATGHGTFSLDTVTGLFTWHIEFTEFATNETFAHIHGPIQQACGSMGGGQIVITLGFGSPKDGSKVLTAQQQQEVLNGLYYVNIHTEQFAQGEISGVILRDPPVPAASTWGMATMAMAVLIGGTLALQRRVHGTA